MNLWELFLFKILYYKIVYIVGVVENFIVNECDNFYV